MSFVDKFEEGAFRQSSEAVSLLAEMFEACGHTVSESGFVDSDKRVDCFIRTDIGGKPQTIAVEVKARMQPGSVASVNQALRLKMSGQFDRAMVISRSGFSAEALRLANTIGLGQIDLFGPGDLRNWLSKYVQLEDVDTAYQRIVRGAMQQLARAVAERPEVLAKIEWRELEKVLREVFEGIGFGTKLTRPGKDGGFDLELSTAEGGQKRLYLVEVKHWAEQKPGPAHLRKFISVTASRQATGGLLLSTSGFSGTVYSGIAEFSAPVRLAERGKVVALCRAYYRLRSALWLEDVSLHQTLFSGTRALGEF